MELTGRVPDFRAAMISDPSVTIACFGIRFESGLWGALTLHHLVARLAELSRRYLSGNREAMMRIKSGDPIILAELDSPPRQCGVSANIVFGANLRVQIQRRNTKLLSQRAPNGCTRSRRSRCDMQNRFGGRAFPLFSEPFSRGTHGRSGPNMERDFVYYSFD